MNDKLYSHFAFPGYYQNKGKDSTACYTSGGGFYSLRGNTYTKHLECCSARAWEQNHFNFTKSIHKDTLIPKGLENIDSLGVSGLNIETYLRVN